MVDIKSAVGSEIYEPENPRCSACSHELCKGDYGYYCCNQECAEYDKDIEVYE